jgi:hypothetical protein
MAQLRLRYPAARICFSRLSRYELRVILTDDNHRGVWNLFTDNSSSRSPSIRGIETSIMTKSGRADRVFSTASRPSRASPQITRAAQL